MTRATLLLLAACTATSSPRTSPTAMRTLVTIPVVCMDPPPDVFVPSFPQADSVGNILFHESTVAKVRDALAGYRRYIDTQWAKCLDRAIEEEIRAQEQP